MAKSSFDDKERKLFHVTKIEVFDPPMCCSTGVCGPSVDPALVGFAADLQWLANNNVDVDRYNMAQEPQAFVANATVKSLLTELGNGCLPLILVNGAIASQGCYPSRKELAAMGGVEHKESVSLPVMPTKCCG